jgi:transcriptional regulator with XRE-family HTH domain
VVYLLRMMQNRLREFRKKRGYTLQQLADAVGTSHQQLQRLESGERRLSDLWIEKLYKPLGCYPSELLPLEWQKPAEAIDIDLLQKAIRVVEEAIEKDENKPNAYQKSVAISGLYEKLRRGESVDGAEILNFQKGDKG